MNQTYTEIEYVRRRAQQMERIRAGVARGKKLMTLLESSNTFIKGLQIETDDYNINVSFFLLRIGALTGRFDSDFIADLMAMATEKSKLMAFLDSLVPFPPAYIGDPEVSEDGDYLHISFSIPMNKISLRSSDVRAVVENQFS